MGRKQNLNIMFKFRLTVIFVAIFKNEKLLSYTYNISITTKYIYIYVVSCKIHRERCQIITMILCLVSSYYYVV